MIQGVVNAAYEAVVTLPLQDPEGHAGHRGRGGHRLQRFPDLAARVGC